MTDFVAGLELPRIAWDEAVPHYAEPSGVEALLLAALIDDEALADLRCEVYPCVAVVTGREWGTDFLDRIQGTLDEVDPNATFYHVTFASPDQHAFTAAVIGGPELQAQQNYLLERVHDAMLDGDWHPGISPVHPSDPEAAEPLWLPDLPGAESSP